MTIEVKTPVFTGPFDLLLHLITGNQVEIYEISLSEIVDDYLREIERLGEIDLETATEFLLIAATLIELKSARLLPAGEGGLFDVDSELVEKRDLLIAKLLEHKTFKGVAEVFREKLVTGGLLFPRAIGPDESFASVMPPLLRGVGVERLGELAARALSRPAGETVPNLGHIYVPPIRFAEVLSSAAERIQAARHISFRDLTSTCESRLDIGLHFLALLELYKRELIDLEQFRTFGEITVIWRGGEAIDLGELAEAVEADDLDSGGGDLQTTDRADR
jgi:segregation and condensation protein A